MKSIKVSCPAKINLTLEVLNRREDGFHNIRSLMQIIDLYDYLDIEIEDSKESEIILSGNSSEIPYDERNLVYKAAELFLKTSGICAKIRIQIDKNIPIAAGLAGGSTDAAGTIFGLNELFDRPLAKSNLHYLCSLLGSDLNVCLEGGCVLAELRGEKITRIDSKMEYPVTLIKPAKLGISAKEAYSKYAIIDDKPKLGMTDKMLQAIKLREDIKPFLYNDLERAIFNDYKELQKIKELLPEAIMTGSGSTFFVLEDRINIDLPEDFIVIEGRRFIDLGIKCNNFVTN